MNTQIPEQFIYGTLTVLGICYMGALMAGVALGCYSTKQLVMSIRAAKSWEQMGLPSIIGPVKEKYTKYIIGIVIGVVALILLGTTIIWSQP